MFLTPTLGACGCILAVLSHVFGRCATFVADPVLLEECFPLLYGFLTESPTLPQ